MKMNEIYETMDKKGNFPYKLIVFDENTADEMHLHLMHWHEYLEIPVTIQGHGKAMINNQKYEFSNHNVFIISPQSLHYIHGYKPYQDNRGYCLQIDLSYFYPLFPSLDKNYKVTCNDNITNQLIRKVIQLDNDINEAKSEFQLIKRIIEILEIVNQQSSDQTIVYSDKNKDRILKIAKFILSHYDEELKINTLADYFSISPGHLQKIFKDHLHQSVYDYISDIRIEHALDDLKYSDYSILDISLKNGFPNNKSFVREFKKRFQMTPRQFRDLKGRQI